MTRKQKKSVTHYTEIVSEKSRPMRCDVFWNNEILSTIRLQRQGSCSTPMTAPQLAAFGKEDKADDHTWKALFATPGAQFSL